MDCGALIPLWFMGGRSNPPAPLVVLTPARDLTAEDHIRAGAAVAAAATESGLRVAFIASADHGHAHGPPGATTKAGGRLVSYEAPTYFGMLTAAYVPATTRGTASPPRKRTVPRTQGR